MISENLSSSTKKWLRGQAHTLKPVVLIGGRGLTDEVRAEVDLALGAHELIKVKISFDRDTRRSMATELAESTGASLAGLVGQVAILFRANRVPADRKYHPPDS